MNIFYIPSWYPSKKNPVGGIFFQEQALGFARNFPKDKIFINTWGYETFALHPNKPIEAISKLYKITQTKPFIKKLGSNIWEINRPCLHWDTRFLKGNIVNLYKAARINFNEAREKIDKIDLIHAHVGFPGGFLAMKLAEEFNVPYVVTEHMGNPFPFKKYLKGGRLVKHLEEPLKKANKVIAVSPFLEKELRRFKIKRTVFIPNAIDEQFFFPKRAKNKKFTFFTLGKITASKGIGDLILAISGMAEKASNVIFRIGGSGTNLKKYQEETEERGLTSSIKWLGQLSRKEVQKEMQSCDCFVLPSHHESFGVVYVEALACGKPVIGTYSGGAECIINPKNGLITKVGDIKGLRGNILKMIKNINRYDPQDIRKYFLENFSYKATAKKIRKVYLEVINNA